MLRDAHVVDIGGRDDVVGHGDRLVPEAEVVDAVGTLRHGEERLSVGAFHAHDDDVLVVPLDGATVERRVHHDALHQKGIVFLVEVIAPGERRVFRRHDGVLILGVDAVAALRGQVGA